MSEVNSPNRETEHSTRHSIISQNGQTVTFQFNAVHDIIFGGYSRSRSDRPPLVPVEASKRYLAHVIDSNQRLQLQGIRSSGELISIELEKIYVTLCAIVGKSRAEEEQWLVREAEKLPGEALRQEMRSHGPP